MQEDWMKETGIVEDNDGSRDGGSKLDRTWW